MSKPTFAIRNGNNSIGILWETKELGKVLVTTGELIDPDHDLEIYDVQKGISVEFIDLRDFLLESLPIK
jgi:hypothetical protein